MKESSHSSIRLAEEALVLVDLEAVAPKAACEKICRRYDVWPFRQRVEAVYNELLRMTMTKTGPEPEFSSEKIRIQRLLAKAEQQVRRTGTRRWWDD